MSIKRISKVISYPGVFWLVSILMFFAIVVFISYIFDAGISTAQDKWSFVSDRFSLILGVPATLVLGIAAVYLGRQATVAGEAQASVATAELLLRVGDGVIEPISAADRSLRQSISSILDLVATADNVLTSNVHKFKTRKVIVEYEEEMLDDFGQPVEEYTHELIDFRSEVVDLLLPICTEKFGTIKSELQEFCGSFARLDSKQSYGLWLKDVARSNGKGHNKFGAPLISSEMDRYFSSTLEKMADGVLREAFLRDGGRKPIANVNSGYLQRNCELGPSAIAALFSNLIERMTISDLLEAVIDVCYGNWNKHFSALVYDPRGIDLDPETEEIPHPPAIDIKQCLDIIGLSMKCVVCMPNDDGRFGEIWRINYGASILLDVLRIASDKSFISEYCKELIKTVAPSASIDDSSLNKHINMMHLVHYIRPQHQDEKVWSDILASAPSQFLSVWKYKS
ncbi:MAG: hypothetical protein ACT6Q8_24270 [Niveispirillum sp.]|uniref:hypothetical protein n=1 Tax=Niveispirillum sp. TaxID=1917217 RepID=UPI0040358EBF